MRTKKPQLPKVTEHELQRSIVRALEAHGHYVYETTAYRQKGSTGVDKGIPDLLVSIKRGSATIAHHLGLEVKRPGRATMFSSHEQEIAWLRGHTLVVTSVEGALKAVQMTVNGYFPIMGDGIHSASRLYLPSEIERMIDQLLVQIEIEKAAKRSERRVRR